MKEYAKQTLKKAFYISLGCSSIFPILFIFILDERYGSLQWLLPLVWYLISLPLLTGAMYIAIPSYVRKMYKDSSPDMDQEISALLDSNEKILWKKVRERYDGYKEFFLLTDSRWIQKKELHSKKNLIGIIMNKDDVINIDLKDINVVFTRAIPDNKYYYIGFSLFYEKECKSNIPILGVSRLNYDESQEFLKIIKKNIDLEEQIETVLYDTIYFRRNSNLT